MKRFHAHVYFMPDELPKAEEFVKKARLKPEFSFCELAPNLVGPHPRAMIELHFRESDHAECTKWIKDNRGSFSVLIHIDTGIDDVKDHTENIQWLGQPLDLDFSFFELIKTRPDLKVHQD